MRFLQCSSQPWLDGLNKVDHVGLTIIFTAMARLSYQSRSCGAYVIYHYHGNDINVVHVGLSRVSPTMTRLPHQSWSSGSYKHPLPPWLDRLIKVGHVALFITTMVVTSTLPMWSKK
jgi:hypothetical protein